VDLVDEDDRLRAACFPSSPRLFHQGLDVLDRARGGGEGDEARPRGPGDDARERGLSGAGRAPEDHGGDAVGLDGVAQEALLAEELFEADHVLELRRT
jgi:hypothetical protein